MSPTPDDYYASIDADLAVLDAIPDEALGRTLPTCPGWTIADLLGHLGQIHRRLDRVLAHGEPFRMLTEQPPPPGPDEVAAWRREQSAAGIGALRRLAPDDETPPWFGGEPIVSAWLRRMAQELAVHRWDVECALGEPAPIGWALAVDGVDEMFELFSARRPEGHWAPVVPGGGSATVHAHAIDPPPDAPGGEGGEPLGEWMLTVDAAGVTMRHEHGKGDVAVQGTASDLLLLVWGRLEPDDAGVTVFGDRALLDRFLRACSY